MYSQTFSIIFWSGDWAGQLRMFICDFWPCILGSISIGVLAHCHPGKIPIPREMSGKDWPQVFLKNFLIFERVYIPFDWRHSSHSLPTDVSWPQTYFVQSFSEQGQVSTLRLFSPDHDSFIMTDYNIGFIGRNHTLPVVYSPNSLSPTPRKPFLTIDMFNNILRACSRFLSLSAK